MSINRMIKLNILRMVFFAFFFKNCAFAGMQIVTSDTAQGGITRLTNFVVMKIETNAIRVDMGSELSIITLPAASEQVQLFHATKTYQWQTTKNNSVVDTNPPVPLPPAIDTTFGGSPARLFCLTNGVEYRHVWVAPSASFFKTSTNFFRNNTTSLNLAQLPRPGSLFDTNLIVVGTEYGTVDSVPLSEPSASDSSPPQLTNVVITQTSRLISIVETNFDASIFILPTNYVEGTGTMQPTAKLDPAKLSHSAAGQGNFEVLRKEYQNGRPLLPIIHFGP